MSETSVSFLYLYGVEFTYLSLNCFFRNTDAAYTSLPLVIFPSIQAKELVGIKLKKGIILMREMLMKLNE